MPSAGAAEVVRSPENEAVVLAMWAAYDRDGLPGIRAYVEEATARGVHVDSIAGLPGRGITNEAFMAMHSGPVQP